MRSDPSTPRLFALPTKKRQRKADVTSEAPRYVANAIDQSTPTPETLNSTPEPQSTVSEDTAGAHHKSNGEQLQEPAQITQNGAVSFANNGSIATYRPSTFAELGLSDWLDKVCHSLGMKQPTQVQAGCIPAILAGRSAIGTAHTGSGKTAAFALPILQLLAKDPYGVYALVLTPTRELAFQLAEQFRALGAGMALRVCVIVGGLDSQAQSRELASRPHVVIATPGRLRALLTEHTGLEEGFGKTRMLVLDEADRLLEPTFEAEMRVIAEALPAKRQTLLFSATMTPSLVKMQQIALPTAYTFQAYEGLETVKKLRQEYLFIPAKVKEVYLYHILSRLEELKIRSAIIFASTCKGAHLLGYVMEELGLQATPLHSHLNQRRRLASLHRFKSGVVPILLATDVAARGLDIPTVDLVLNFDLPLEPRDYVHRVGRTARAGRGGWSLAFVTQYDVDLVHEVEATVGATLESFDVPEKEALANITKVFSAKRAAAMRVAEESTSDKARPQRLSFDAKKRKANRIAAEP